MAVRSSSAVVLRALVMLTCLVAVPLAAVFGTSLPGMVKAALNGQWPLRSASPQHESSEGLRFEPTGPVQTANATLSSEPSARDWFSEPLMSIPSWPGAANESSPPAVAAGFEAPVEPAAESADHVPPGRTPVSRDLGFQQGAAVSPGQNGGVFIQIQDRLRQLGATYYLLESWGDRQQLYRFYCQVAVGGNPNFTRYFEATDPDCLRAMQLVLQQVEAWRAGR